MIGFPLTILGDLLNLVLAYLLPPFLYPFHFIISDGKGNTGTKTSCRVPTCHFMSEYQTQYKQQLTDNGTFSAMPQGCRVPKSTVLK
jgi:hypothetical protein